MYWISNSNSEFFREIKSAEFAEVHSYDFLAKNYVKSTFMKHFSSEQLISRNFSKELFRSEDCNKVSHFFDKNFAKVTILPKKLLKSCWFDEIFFGGTTDQYCKFFIFHIALWQKISWNHPCMQWEQLFPWNWFQRKNMYVCTQILV